MQILSFTTRLVCFALQKSRISTGPTYFVQELRSALAGTSFREVFLVTEIDDRKVYVRLKMLILLADLYFFSGALSSHCLAAKVRLGAGVGDVELFAAYFAGTVDPTVLVHQNGTGTEVIFGESGVMIGHDGSVTVRLYADLRMHSDARPPQLQWRSLLGSDFHDVMMEYRKTHTFSTAAVFPITESK